MNKKLSYLPVFCLFILTLFLLSCSGSAEKKADSGKACLGKDGDTLFEALSSVADSAKACKKGDIIVTKNPAFFCDFTYAVAFNSFNSAHCVYVGDMRDPRHGSTLFTDYRGRVFKQ